MPSHKVESHPTNPAYFVSCTDRLNLFEIGDLDAPLPTACIDQQANTLRYRQANLKSSRPLAGLTCLDWCRDESKPCVLGFGTSKGDVFVLNWDRNTETKISAPETVKRQCTDIVWCAEQTNKLAVGYEKARGQQAVVVYEISPYDINFQSPRATAFPAFSDTAASLAWVPKCPSLLAVGTMAGWIRVHDCRSGNLADMNILAHTDPKNRRVKGIRFDPFNEHVFATFSDLGNEPVKIWDMRKVEKSKDPHVLTIDPFQYLFGSAEGAAERGVEQTKPNALVSEGVADIEWSTVRQDVLAVATTHDPRVFLYSTCKASNSENVSRVPLSDLNTNGSEVTSLSWMKRLQVEPTEGAERTESVDPDITSKNRLLIGSEVGVTDVCVLDSVPLAVSCSWSPVVMAAGCGSEITVHSSTIGYTAPSGAAQTGATAEMPEEGNIAALTISLSTEPPPPEDEEEAEPIDQVMVSMCKAGYAVDAGKNIQVIADKLDALAYTSPASFTKRSRILLQLQRVWCWVDRVESMSILDTSLSLQNCGVLQLIQASDATAAQELLLDSMPCRVFESPSRKAARSVCGWATLKLAAGATDTVNVSELDPHEARYLDLEDLVEEYVKYDTFERACALALWHGDLNLAVDVLRRTMEHLSNASGSGEAGNASPWHVSRRESLNEDEDDEEEVASVIDLSHISIEYKKLVPLVAMCLAGFPKDDVNNKAIPSGKKAKKGDPAAPKRDAASSLWPSMCGHLINQLRQVTERPSVCYLIGACEFLLCLLGKSSVTPKHPSTREVPPAEARSPAVLQYAPVLYSENLAIEDRCGFACTYLSPPDLVPYLKSLQTSSLSDCDIEGVILMGLSSSPQTAGSDGVGVGGLQLLQKYLDARCDIQTVALLVSRLPLALTTSPNSEYSIEGEWLTCYRNLLNRWKLYMERASLDVELGKRFRQLKTHMAATEAIARKAAGHGAANRPPESAKVVYPLPQHMEDEASHMCMKCSYCSVALPVDPMDKKHSGSVWMRRQRPLMNCCPNCKKPLPRCYVCLFFTGVLNPQMELKVIAKRREIEHSVGSLLSKPVASGAAPPTSGEAGVLMNEQLSALETIEQNLFDQGKWFMWCQRCKHGGHAGCLDKWFSEGRQTCGVNGCSCKCSTSTL